MYITIEVHADNHGPELGLKQRGCERASPTQLHPIQTI